MRIMFTETAKKLCLGVIMGQENKYRNYEQNKENFSREPW